MKLSTTLVLLLLTGALLVFVFIQERRQPGTSEKMALETKPFRLQPADADEIEIEHKEGKLRLQKQADTWNIVHPFQDPADLDLVKKLLEAVPAITWVDTVERDDMRREDQRRTGLGEDAVKLTVRREGSELAQLSIGAPAALEGCVYASRLSQKDEVHVARTILPALLAKTDDEWRDPVLVRLRAETLRRISIHSAAGAMEFARQGDGPWQMVKPIQTRASENALKAVVIPFATMKVKPSRNATPTPSPSADAQPTVVTFENEGAPKPIVIKVHSNADPSGEAQVQASHRDGVFLAAPEFNGLKFEPKDLRDQHLVSIPKEQVNALRITALTSPEVVLAKQGDVWFLKRFGGKGELANQERVSRLFTTLNTAQVREFLSDASASLEPYGLHQPFLTIEWQAGEKKTALQFGQGADGILTARVTDEPFIYRARTELLNAIPTDSLRWKTTKIINASIFAVRRIIVAEGDRPAVALVHNATDTSWTASVAARDVTAQVDRTRANQLLQKLVNFEAADWNSNRGEALLALKNPSLTIQLILANPLDPSAQPKPVTLTFAPLQPGIDTSAYHGRKDEEPDTFLITREQYHDLIAPVVK
jgi:hypothetical protein